MSESQSVEAPPVRVPNVSPGARSGLDHEVIGSNAAEAYAANVALSEQEPAGEEVPDFDATWSAEERLQWVREGEDHEQRGNRADAIYSDAKSQGADDQALDLLGADLREAVYHDGGDPLDMVMIPEDLTSVGDLLDWVSAAEDDAEEKARAEAVLGAEREKPEEDQRKTLVEPLEALLTDPPAGD